MPTTTSKTTSTTKNTTRAPRKKTSTTKKTSTRRKTPNKELPAMDKEQLITGLQRTMKDMGKLPGMFLAPVIAYVSTKYESIPAARRKKLEEIVKSGKEQGGSLFSKLKDRFMDRFNDAKETVTSDTDKKPVKKRTPRKKTTTPSKKTPTKTTTSSVKTKTIPPNKTSTPSKTTKKPTTKKASD